MTKAIRIHEAGGPETLKWEDVDIPAPGAGEVTLNQTACGLNFIDIYQRSGLYPVKTYPQTMGMEAVGIVDEVGEGVEHLKSGDRVAYCMVLGGYAERRVAPAAKLVKVPDTIDDQTAAAMMLKGLTAHYLSHRTYPIKPGDTVLVYAAAGGVGLILCQWAKHMGATVIGCVGSQEKAELARANGCDHPILYRDEDIVAQVRDITDGAGVQAAYDSVGKDTFDASIDSLAPLGILASFGASSGPVAPFNPGMLARKGSLYFTRPTLATHTANRVLLEEGANDLFNAIADGHVKFTINQTYDLADTEQAHRDLEGRKTTGCTVLLP